MTVAFPSADQIAVALVAAARMFGEDPLLIALQQRSKARYYAMSALTIAFPEARKRGLARCVGFGDPEGWCCRLISAKRAKDWSDDKVDEIVGALVGDALGEQAA